MSSPHGAGSSMFLPGFFFVGFVYLGRTDGAGILAGWFAEGGGGESGVGLVCGFGTGGRVNLACRGFVPDLDNYSLIRGHVCILALAVSCSSRGDVPFGCGVWGSESLGGSSPKLLLWDPGLEVGALGEGVWQETPRWC